MAVYPYTSNNEFHPYLFFASNAALLSFRFPVFFGSHLLSKRHNNNTVPTQMVSIIADTDPHTRTQRLEGGEHAT